MNLVKIEIEDGSKVVYLTTLNPDLNEEEFLSENTDYFYTNIEINPDFHYEFKNGIVELNQEKTNIKISKINKEIIEDLLRKTDKYMLVDNPFNITSDQLAVLTTYRQELRDLFYSELALNIPVKPYFI